jgi:nicotinate-nucleotide adenylyltransferase
MRFYKKAEISPRRLGVYPGTFNPVTIAHLALAEAALGLVDEVLFVLPGEFPHKPYSGASFNQRMEILRTVLAGHEAFSLAAAEGGLFSEIASEVRQHYPDGVQVSFLCGRDAAERVATWDYGHAEAFAAMLSDFDLLVAARGGEYAPPPGLRHAFASIPIPSGYEEISASEVRRRIAAGEDWEMLVPAAAWEGVRQVYAPDVKAAGAKAQRDDGSYRHG